MREYQETYNYPMSQKEGAIYHYRICDACFTPYSFKPWWGNIYGDDKFCPYCTDKHIEQLFKMPKQLISIKRLQLAGRRILLAKYKYFELNLLSQISKTQDHESRTAAQSFISYLKASNLWEDR